MLNPIFHTPIENKDVIGLVVLIGAYDNYSISWKLCPKKGAFVVCGSHL